MYNHNKGGETAVKKISILLVLAMLAVCLTACASSDYKKASDLMEAGSYSEAKAIFETLGDYKDSTELSKECSYNQALGYIEESKLEDAAGILEALGSYKDSADRLLDVTDGIIAEKLVGKWESQVINMKDDFVSSIAAGIGEADAADAFFSYCTFDDMNIVVTAEFKEDGNYNIYVEDSYCDNIYNSLFGGIKAGFLDYLQVSLEDALREEGLTLDDLYSELQVSTIEEVAESQLGMSVDEFVFLCLGGENFDLAEAFKVTSRYSVDSGEISMLNLYGILDLDADVLTIKNYDESTDADSIYPADFTRAG